MVPEELDYLLRFNELRNTGPRRLRINFSNGTYTIVLLNDNGLPLLSAQCLVGHSFITQSALATGINSLVCTCHLDESFGFNNPEEKPEKIQAWHLYSYDGNLIIPTHSISITEKSVDAEKIIPVGLIITGKDNIASSTIESVEVVPKNTPTPFIFDKYGDSYNDNFFSEPRIIESVPSTVFSAVNSILASARSAFQAKDFLVAARKFHKAFHYCHKYYPETLEDDELKEATDLKIKSLLNLALSGLKVDDELSWKKEAIEACNFVLDMPEANTSQRAKAYYRKGMAELQLGDDVLAKDDLTRSLNLQDDPATVVALEKCGTIEKNRNLQLKQSLRQAFTE